MKKIMFIFTILQAYNLYADELGLNYEMLTKKYTMYDESISYKKDYKDESYKFKLGERNNYYKKTISDSASYAELEQVLKSKKSYWQNFYFVSGTYKFLPTYQVDFNKFFIRDKEELGIGLKYSSYKKQSIIDPKLMAVIYLDNSDFFGIRGDFVYYQHLVPYFSIYYNKYINEHIALKPYFFFGKSIEDINVIDNFSTIGLEVKFKFQNFSLTPFIENYHGLKYRDESKVGLNLTIPF